MHKNVNFFLHHFTVKLHTTPKMWLKMSVVASSIPCNTPSAPNDPGSQSWALSVFFNIFNNKK